MNIGYNKSTKELIGYSTPKNGRSLVVTAYAVDDLEIKFNAALNNFLEDEKLLDDAAMREITRIMIETD